MSEQESSGASQGTAPAIALWVLVTLALLYGIVETVKTAAPLFG